jgi:hypothetical protein
MTHKIIHTNNYLLVVDNSEIKMDDWYLDDNNNLRISVTSDKDYWSKRNRYKKVIAHLPLNDSPILQGVDLLPPLEDDVKKLAKEYIDDEWQKDDDAVKFGIKVGYVQGYNKAKEKYKYTEEDIKNAYTKGFSEGIVFGASPLGYKHITSEEYIQSPSQQKMPTHFEVLYDIDTLLSEGKVYLMTTINSQGQTVLVGKYIY